MINFVSPLDPPNDAVRAGLGGSPWPITAPISDTTFQTDKPLYRYCSLLKGLRTIARVKNPHPFQEIIYFSSAFIKAWEICFCDDPQLICSEESVSPLQRPPLLAGQPAMSSPSHSPVSDSLFFLLLRASLNAYAKLWMWAVLRK
jgi:hypothetical protein